MTNEQAFEQGFIDKCAEYGVDPQELVDTANYVKEAQVPWLGNALNTGKNMFGAVARNAGKLNNYFVDAGKLSRTQGSTANVFKAWLADKARLFKNPDLGKVAPVIGESGSGALARQYAALEDVGGVRKALQARLATRGLQGAGALTMMGGTAALTRGGNGSKPEGINGLVQQDPNQMDYGPRQGAGNYNGLGFGDALKGQAGDAISGISNWVGNNKELAGTMAALAATGLSAKYLMGNKG